MVVCVSLFIDRWALDWVILGDVYSKESQQSSDLPRLERTQIPLLADEVMQVGLVVLSDSDDDFIEALGKDVAVTAVDDEHLLQLGQRCDKEL